MKTILLAICFLHLVITKNYLVKTRDQGQTDKQEDVEEDHGIDYCQPPAMSG